MSMRKVFAKSLLASVLGLASASVFAQATAEDRLRDQLRKTTVELRKAQDENAELSIRLNALSQQVAAQPAKPEKKADDAQTESLRRSLRAQAAQQAALQQQLAATQASLAQWQQAQAEAVATAKARDADAKKYEALYRDVDSHVKTCDQNNIKLVKISEELLDRYKNKGVWDAARGAEPLTGLGRVELEKIAQDYHGRIVDSSAVATPPPQP